MKVIRPRKPIVNADRIRRDLTEEMRGFIRGLVGDFKEYPAATVSKSGYRRTGTLKRSWFGTVETKPDLIVGRVASDPQTFLKAYYTPLLKSGRLGKARRIKEPYATRVMGKEQTALMKRRGWKKGIDILKGAWPAQVRRFQAVISRAK
jgi:hypothetical protein